MKDTSILDALASRRMFVLHRITPGDKGKTDKIPVHPLTGAGPPDEPLKDGINGQDPSHWMLPHEALLWAEQWNAAKPAGVLGYGVGIVLYEGCGFVCLDFDGCRDINGGWMPHVANFERRFPDAYRETSFSTTGRHLFASFAGVVPSHGTRNKLYRMEAYSKLRFIALTGTDAQGSILTDCTPQLSAFLAEFFPERAEAEHGTEWTEAPVPSWIGPSDDAQLIGKALRSHGLKAIFGGGAAFADLWRADVDILAKIFPPERAGQSYNASSADQALANHLAFWTGNDCERMARLMRESGLVRSKYDRPDYLRRTILEACGTQREWYIDPQGRALVPQGKEGPLTESESVQPALPSGFPLSGVPLPPTVPAPPILSVEFPDGVPKPPVLSPLAPTLPPGALPPVGEYANIHTLKQLFLGMCYVQDIHAIQLVDGSTATKERFDSMLGGPLYAMTADGQKPSKSAWDAYTLSEIYRFPRVESQYFKPADVLGNIRVREGRHEINMYKPANVRRAEGNPEPFLDLVRRMLPNGNDANILLYYMAACVQNLGQKFTWTPFLQGAKGNGKTTIGKVLEYCLSQKYTHWAKADQLGEKFNSVLVGKLLVVVDEMYSDDARELQEVLKQLVTADRIEVRPMYGEKTMKEVCFNMLLISNHQNGVRIDPDERRYSPLFCAQQTKADRIKHGLTGEYFVALRKWLWGNDSEGAAIVFGYLSDLSIPDELNPATDCIYAPMTSSTELAATASLGGVEQELIEAVKQQLDGFRNGWISSHAVDLLLARVGRERAIPRNARKGLVTALGYVPHPSLPEGVCSVPMPDGNRPRLYVEKGHPWAVGYLSIDQVREGYLDAQKRV